MDARRVIALVRVSSEAQAGSDRAGISRQREAVARIASAHGLTVVETVELHVSGASVRREAAHQRMLARLAEPGIIGIIVAETSRLMRPERFEDYAVLDAFRDAGKLLYTPDGPQDVRTFTGRLTTVLKHELDAWERQQIRERTMAGRENLRRQGHKAEANGLPRGVTYDFEARRWAYVEPEASRVREAYRLVLGGVTNLSEIARRCGWGGGKAAHGSWAARSVLRQPLYAGLYHGVPAPGLDPPLVPESEWLAVQRILEAARGERRPRRSGDETGAVYAGHLSCALCGAAMWALPPRRDGRGYAVYLCAHARDRRCPTGSISARLADPILDAALQARLGTLEMVRRLVEAAGEEGPAPLGWERARAQLANRRAARLRQHEMGAISDRELGKVLAALDAEALALEAAQDRAGREIVVDAEVCRAVARTFALWPDLAAVRRRALLRDLGVRVSVSRPGPRRLVVERIEIRALHAMV